MTLHDQINQVIDEAISSARITGTVVLVNRDGQPAFQRAAGFADPEASRPVGFDTIFRLASVTKPIVAATALALVERGRLTLQDLVSDHLPWFQPRLANGREAAITVHHLLTHTSGLVYDPALEQLGDGRSLTMGLADTDLDFEANFSRYNAVPLAFEPGTRWAYSFATDILGAIIAKVHGSSLEDAVVEHVAGPLGMDDTRFHVTDPNRLAVPYADAPGGAVRMPDPWSAMDPDGWTLSFSPARIFNPKAFQSGGAGMAGTAGDILTFLEALRAGGRGILLPETVKMGMTNRIERLEMDTPGTRFGYFGAVVEDPRLAMTPQSAGTVRWGGVYGLNWFIDPVEKITAISVTNNALEGCMGGFPDDIVKAIYAA